LILAPAKRLSDTQLPNQDFAAPIISTDRVTLYRGDYRDVLPLISDDCIDTIIADPPFYLEVPGDQTVIDYYIGKNGMRPRFRQPWDRFADAGEYLEFCDELLSHIKRVLALTGSAFVFTVHSNLGMVDLAIRRAGMHVLHHIVWLKRNPTPMISTRRLQFSHETIIWCAKSSDYTFNYAELKDADFVGDRFKTAGRQHRDVIETNTSSGESVGHPAQKPVDLYRRLLNMAGRRGGVLLDPCAGSGTAAVAAGSYGMKTIMIERETRYIDIIKARVSAIGRRTNPKGGDTRRLHRPLAIPNTV
jgi:DNA modification methylase